jgi:hypothetical protein
VRFAKSASTCLKYDFDQLGPDALASELATSKKRFVGHFGGGVTKLSSPGGMINRPVIRTALSLGMRLWAIP